MPAAGFVLVGGQSSRMGRDKALLPLHSRPLVDHMAQAVKTASGSVTLVGTPERYRHLKWPVIADVAEGIGPLGGIAAALGLRLHSLNLIVACDLAGLNGDWFSALIRRAEESSRLCVVSRGKGGDVQPLCGVYRSDCLPLIESMIRRKDYRVQNLTLALDAEILEAEEPIANLNTPEEWSAWLFSTRMQGTGPQLV